MANEQAHIHGNGLGEAELLALLGAVASGSVGPEMAAERLRGEAKLGFANLDLHRAARTGDPEVVYGEGKSAGQIATALMRLREAGQAGLVTRVDAAKAAEVRARVPEVVDYSVARILSLPVPGKIVEPIGHIGVVCAGTSDLPVAEEAAVTAEVLGHRVTRVVDVGVAGLHRLLRRVETLREARVLIAVAGMEGALPSVLTGLVSCPVIGVPTSVGYGAHLGGITPLLAMLNSCASGLSVVNIDNGFGAALQAGRINRIGENRG